MASRTIFTDIFRASYVHLKERHAFQATDKPAFKLKAMFPSSGTGVISKTGVQFASSINNIKQALVEVTTEEWNWAFNEAESKAMGIQFPPSFENGDLKLQRDNAGNPIPGTVDPNTKGYQLISFKNEDLVGIVGPDGKDIDPSTVYSGCWCRAQIEVSAYTNKQGSRIIAIKLLNVQMCYDDESFGRGPSQAASEAFAGMAITDSNIASGTGQVMGAINTPPAAPQAPQAPQAPAMPAAPKYVHTCTDFTEEQYRADPVWTTEMLVQHGKGRMEQPAPAAPAAPATPAAPAMPAAPATPATPATPAAPATPQPSVPLTGKVIMKPDSPYTYEQLTGEYGWTDDQIIAGGYATPNYTNPA